MDNPKFQENRKVIIGELKKVADFTLEAHGICMESVRNLDSSRLGEVEELVIQTDKVVNDIDNHVITTIALYGPEASELRELIAYLKITNEFERIGIAAKKYSIRIYPYFQILQDNQAIRDDIVKLHECSIKTIEYAKNACTTPDEEAFDYESNLNLARAEEEKTDVLYVDINKNMLDQNLHQKLHDPFSMFNSIRRLERSADHAINICSLMKYAKKGGKMKLY